LEQASLPALDSPTDRQASNSDPAIFEDDNAPAFEIRSEVVEIGKEQ